MDHNEAVRLHAAEKYLLGEMPQIQRDEYEEHYFTCASCAEDLKASALFMEGARQVLGEENLAKMEPKSRARDRAPWFAWLRPAFAVPVFAALLLFIGYQNAITIPGLKQVASHSAKAEVVKSLSLLGVGSRSEGSASIAVRPGEELILQIEIPPADSICQIQDEHGRILSSLAISAEQAKETVLIRPPAGSLQPGKYALVILSAQPSGAQVAQQKEILRLRFTIEFQR
jgi:hypothetical protein